MPMKISLISTYGERFQNNPLGYPFWRTGKRKQSYLVQNLGRSFFCWVLVLVCFSYWVPAVPTRSMAPGFTTYSHCTLTCNGIIRGFPSAGNRRRQSWFIESFQQNGSMEAGFPLDAIFLCIDESGPLSFVITVHKDYCLKLLILSKIVLPIINLWN